MTLPKYEPYVQIIHSIGDSAYSCSDSCHDCKLGHCALFLQDMWLNSTLRYIHNYNINGFPLYQPLRCLAILPIVRPMVRISIPMVAAAFPCKRHAVRHFLYNIYVTSVKFGFEGPASCLKDN